MTPTEWRRRLLHILPGFLPLVLWYIPHHDPLSWDSRLYMAMIIVAIGAGTAVKYQQIARRGETMNAACILGYALPIFLLLMLIPAHAELGLTVLAVLAIGDGSATLGGMILQGPRLPWNRNKSWSGLLCFLVLGSIWSSLIYWGEASPVVPFSIAFVCAGTATFVAGICESLDSQINDNIRVGIAASVVVIIMHWLMVGM
jgi:dolichol kinase